MSGKSWTDTLTEVLEGATEVVRAADPYLPRDVASPVRVAGLLLEDALGVTHHLSEQGVARAAAVGAAAGESANKASKLAGMREAVFKIINNIFDNDEEAGYCANAIMAEIARRL